MPCSFNTKNYIKMNHKTVFDKAFGRNFRKIYIFFYSIVSCILWFNTWTVFSEPIKMITHQVFQLSFIIIKGFPLLKRSSCSELIWKNLRFTERKKMWKKEQKLHTSHSYKAIAVTLTCKCKRIDRNATNKNTQQKYLSVSFQL